MGTEASLTSQCGGDGSTRDDDTFLTGRILQARAPASSHLASIDGSDYGLAANCVDINMNIFARLLPLPVTVALVACGGALADEVAETEECDANHPTEVDGSYLKYPVDTNGDCEPDFWKFYELLDDDGNVIADPSTLSDEELFAYIESKRVREKWLDLNFDGVVDTVRRYDASEVLIEQQVDSDFDGIIDRTDFFEDGLLTSRSSDADSDGTAETTRYYRGSELYRAEIDSDGNGSPDEWRFYGDGEILRIGLDTTGDGDIDEWVRRPTVANSSPVAPATPAEEPADAEETE